VSRHAVEFGIRLPVAGTFAEVGNITEVALHAEELGYDALWVHDYLIWNKDLDRRHVSCGSIETVIDDRPPVFYESITTLAYLAGLTSQIRLGFSVLILPYREPIAAAKQLATLDTLSKGRLILGLGAGATRKTGNVDFEVLGIDRRTKYERLREYLESMQAIWTQDPAEYHGEYVDFAGAVVYPRPVQQPGPEIWMAGVAPRGMDLVARFASGWLPTWLTPAGYPEKISELSGLLEGYGRRIEDVRVGDEIVVCVGADDADAGSRSTDTVKTFTAGFTARSEEDAIAASLIGGVDTLRRRAHAFVDAGVQHFEMKPIYHSLDDLKRQMDRFASSVMAEFR
jgi:probable F420-dependent oxidoreductase